MEGLDSKQKYDELKRLYGLKDKTIAEWFGYANVLSFLNSSGKRNIENGLVKFDDFLKEKIIKEPGEEDF